MICNLQVECIGYLHKNNVSIKQHCVIDKNPSKDNSYSLNNRTVTTGPQQSTFRHVLQENRKSNSFQQCLHSSIQIKSYSNLNSESDNLTWRAWRQSRKRFPECTSSEGSCQHKVKGDANRVAQLHHGTKSITIKRIPGVRLVENVTHRSLIR